MSNSRFPPANAYGATRSVQRTLPSTRNDTCRTGPPTVVRHGTSPAITWRSVSVLDVDLQADVLVAEEALRIREALDEPHEVPPVPVRPGIGVVVDAAALKRVVRVGHLVVADDVPPVDRDQRTARDHRGEPGGRAVLRAPGSPPGSSV